MSSYALPKAGTRGRCVLDALLSFPVGPVEERALMARHLLNHQSAANWRKVVYQRLQDDYLITPGSDGFNGVHRWMLTNKALRLLLAEQAAAVAATASADLEPAPACNLVPPRTVRPFRPLSAGTVGMRVMRDGALDYQSIPSLMGERRCAWMGGR